eukprot:scaffold12837_cov51-Attheya_sp.AAC.2
MSKKVINARIISSASMIRDDDDDDSLSPSSVHVTSTVVSQAIKSGRNPLSRRRNKSLPCSYNTGRWSEEERYLFLRGLTRFGNGRWKQVGSILRTRSLIQIKSHGQKMKIKLDNGENIFAEMNEYDRKQGENKADGPMDLVEADTDEEFEAFDEAFTEMYDSETKVSPKLGLFQVRDNSARSHTFEGRLQEECTRVFSPRSPSISKNENDIIWQESNLVTPTCVIKDQHAQSCSNIPEYTTSSLCRDNHNLAFSFDNAPLPTVNDVAKALCDLSRIHIPKSSHPICKLNLAMGCKSITNNGNWIESDSTRQTHQYRDPIRIISPGPHDDDSEVFQE